MLSLYSQQGQPDTGSRMDGLRPATSAAANIRQYPIGQQKMRIVMGTKGGVQQQPPYLGLNINSPYDPYGDDEDMDDEEEVGKAGSTCGK